MNTTLKMFPNINKMNAVDYINSAITWNINFEAELQAKRDHEVKLHKKGHLNETSQEVARVLILRYNEILGEEQ